MTDIELVIKIPKYMFEDIQDRYKHPNKGNGISLLEDAVASGIVLPKGHGELKDIDQIINDGINKGFCDWYDEMEMADTIVQADKDDE